MVAGRGAGLVCFDIAGTLTDGTDGPELPGAVAAVRRVAKQLPVRFVTNVTSRTHGALAAHLAGLGILDDPEALVTPATCARRVLEARGHASGLLLAEELLREDFGWFREDPAGTSVLVATEAHDRTIAELQPAFRRLLEGAPFYALQRNRYFRRGDELLTDVGPVVALLGYAADREAEILGKPSPLLFDALAGEVGVARQRLVMVGDDAEFDASASAALGMAGVLVRTGKYRAGDELRVDPAPSAVLDSVADLPDWLGLP